MEYFTTGDATSHEDIFSVLVMSTSEVDGYSGISAHFMRDGKIELDVFVQKAREEVKNDKEEIILTAKNDFQKAIDQHINGEEVGDYTTLPSFK